MSYEFKVTRTVEFSETDMAGIVHFSNFFRYMDAVEHAFYRSLGFSAMTQDTDPPLGWPRVHASCDYRRPLRFENLVEIHLLVAARKARTLEHQIRFYRLDPATRERLEEVARGKVVVVCVARAPDGSFQATPIPAAIAERIQVAPPALLE